MLDDFMTQLSSMFISHLEWIKFLDDSLMPKIIILSLISLMLIEMILAKCHQSRIILIKSYLTNLATFVFNNFFLTLFSISSLLLLTKSYTHHGLLSDYNQTLQILISFVLFDLTLYLWHKANHDFECLWMFHKVHHSDKSMNATTAFRVHFVEIILGILVKSLFILVSGVEIAIVGFCEGVSTLFVMLHHFNFSIKGERWLKWLFIIPSLHRVHHSTLRKEHDSNYGAVFSLWDRMFRTLTELRPDEIGLTNVKTLNFYELLKFGLLTDLSMPENDSSKTLQPEVISAMVAEAAYYLAEKRGFVSGFDAMDWLEAEKQIYKFNCMA